MHPNSRDENKRENTNLPNKMRVRKNARNIRGHIRGGIFRVSALEKESVLSKQIRLLNRGF